MKFLPYLLYFSAAGPAVLCRDLDGDRPICFRDGPPRSQVSRLKGLSKRRVQDLVREPSRSDRQTRELQQGPMSPSIHMAEQPGRAIRRREIGSSVTNDHIRNIQQLSDPQKYQTRHHESVTSNADEPNSVSDRPISHLRRRGNCFGSLCGAKERDLMKLDPPYGPSPASSPSQSFIAPSPFSMVPENAAAAAKAQMKASSSRRVSDSVKSVGEGSPTSPLLGEESKRKDSAPESAPPAGSANTSPEFSLTRSRGSTQLTEEFNKAFSVLEKTPSGSYRPGLQQKGATPGVAKSSPRIGSKHSQDIELPERKSDKASSSSREASDTSIDSAMRSESGMSSSGRSHPHDEGSSKPTSGESSDSAKLKGERFKYTPNRQAAIAEALSSVKLSQPARRRTKLGGTSPSKRRSRGKTDVSRPMISGTGSSASTARRQKKTDKDSDRRQPEATSGSSSSGDRRSQKTTKRKDGDATGSDSKKTKPHPRPKSPARAIPPLEKSKSN